MATEHQELAFFNSMWPLCIANSKATGVHAEIIFAQSALETGYGVEAPQNNYFGIKGPGESLTTVEYIHGVAHTLQQHFAGYPSMAESAAGYARFINTNRRYIPFKNAGSLAAQLVALGQSGYATDPKYVSKLEPIIDNLARLEKESN